MRSVQRGFSLIELMMVVGIMTVIAVSFVSAIAAIAEPHQEKVVITQRAESGEITLIKPKTDLISIENSVREHELNSAPNVGKTLSEMASQPSIKPKIYVPGVQQTTEAF